ncbi:MAG: DUF937 domain-containing protein [Pseudomonadales bacterium]
MDLLGTMFSAGNGRAVSEIAHRLGLSDGDARKLIGTLAPALGQGIAKKSADPANLNDLLKALKSGNHERFLDDPAQTVSDSGIAEGNKILGHILGSKDVSRKLASQAAEQTGISDSLIKQMLPMVAALAMSALSKQTSEAGGSESLGGLLGGLLGGGDNPKVDDLLGMAGKLFGR